MSEDKGDKGKQKTPPPPPPKHDPRWIKPLKKGDDKPRETKPRPIPEKKG